MTTELLMALGEETGLRQLDLQRIMVSAPHRYKVYSIPKRSGGSRQIAQPAREVKAVQRALMRVLLEELPVHAAATAYRKGISIRDNARPHAASGPILKLDLKNFFPSIRVADWVSYCGESGCLTERTDVALTAQLLFFKPKGTRSLSLAIGAPSSPILSNILMYKFDESLSEELSKDKVIYTRYADDMTFSAPRTGYLTGVMSTVARRLRRLQFPKLSINGEKTTYVTMKYHRAVTGLTLANDGRVTIGRNQKRTISASVHHAVMGTLDAEDKQMLSGMLAFINAVEPAFIGVLRRKYGNAIIADIQMTTVPRRPRELYSAR